LFHGKPFVGGAVERGDGLTPMAEPDIPRFKAGNDGIDHILTVATGAGCNNARELALPRKPVGIP
jgi:nickel transport protein